MILARGRKVLEIESRALAAAADGLGPSFEAAVHRIHATKGRVILTGVGKSGIICRKIAATLASTGTPAFFLHPTDAVHGDSGMIVSDDTVVALSNSGETQELQRLVELLKRLGVFLIAMIGNRESYLGKQADICLAYSVDEEGCPLGLAPMASTTVCLALGDALAAAVMEQKGFTSEAFSRLHPAGKLGLKVRLVADVLRKHEEPPPIVDADTLLSQALIEISQKRFGMTAVDLGKGQLGIISDGDIRRLLQTHGHSALEMRAGEVSSKSPITIALDRLASEALNLMEKHKITAIIVRDRDGAYAGVLHLHDLWQIQLI